jgi:YcxB-like protein
VSFKFSVRYDEQNYLEANRLHFWSNVRSLKGLRSLAWLFGIYFVLGLIVIILDEVAINGGEILRISVIALAGGVAVLLFCYAFGYVMLPRRTRKLLAQQKLLHEDLHYDVTDEILNVTSPLSTTKLPYDRAHKWAEDSRVFLIYLSDNSFLYIPLESTKVSAINMIRASLVAAGISGRTL